MNSTSIGSNSAVTRRQFLKPAPRPWRGPLLGALPLGRSAHAAGSDLLKIALVGCGGRGSGAADQALKTAGSTKLVAMADVLPDKLEKSLASLQSAACRTKSMFPPTTSSPTSTATRRPSRWRTW